MAWRSLLQWVGGQGHSARDGAPGGGGLSQRWHLILEEETSSSPCFSGDKGGSVQAQETPAGQCGRVPVHSFLFPKLFLRAWWYPA